jgi:hypothetical protein
MNLRDYVSQKLREDDYGGLFNADEDCGCILDDLMPCGEPGENCEPGYAGTGINDDGCGWLVYRERKP